MRTIMLLNAKGGCGKSTLATNLASYYAYEKEQKVVLVDFDQQLSSLAWLKARSPQWPEIIGVNGVKGQVRIPTNADVIIIDSPARVYSKELTQLIRRVETIIVPVLASPVDIRAAESFIRKLMVNGKINREEAKVAVVANRVKENTLIYRKLESFLKNLDIPFIASLRDTQNYIRSQENGMGLFEMAPSLVEKDMDQWKSLLCWVNSKRSQVANKKSRRRSAA